MLRSDKAIGSGKRYNVLGLGTAQILEFRTWQDREPQTFTLGPGTKEAWRQLPRMMWHQSFTFKLLGGQ